MSNVEWAAPGCLMGPGFWDLKDLKDFKVLRGGCGMGCAEGLRNWDFRGLGTGCGMGRKCPEQAVLSGHGYVL